MSEILAHLAWSIAAMARAKNLTKRHQLDELVRRASNALAEGASPRLALEAARIAAVDMQQCESVSHIVDQLIEQARQSAYITATKRAI